MLSPETQEKLLSLLAEIVRCESTLESARVDLANVQDFEPFTCFSSLDRFSQGFLTCADVLKFLRSKGVTLTEKDGFLLAKALDSNGDGKVTYHDFLRFVLPSSKVYLSTLAVQRKARREGLHGEVEQRVFALFETLLAGVRDVEKGRQAVFARGDFTLLDGFRWMDELNVGYISELSIRRILARLHLETSAKLILTRFDTDCDGKLSYLEYVDLVMPMQQLYREPSSASKPSHGQRSTTPSPVRSRMTPQLSSSPKKRAHPDSSFTHLAHLLQVQCSVTHSTELAKEALSLRPDFSLTRLFRVLRKAGKWIRISDLCTMLKNLDMDLSDEELFLLVGTVEVVLAGKVDAGMIVDMVTPKQLDYARLLSTRIIGGGQGFTIDNFSEETLKSLASVFEAQLSAKKSIESEKQLCISQPDFHPSEAFSELDTDKTGKITIDQLHHTMKRYGVFATHRDLMPLFNSYDSNQDGTISYSEFVRAVTPRLAAKRTFEELSTSVGP